MSHTVAIYGATGNVGSAAFKSLIENKANVKIVLLHRPGSKIDALPSASNVEPRPVDVEDAAGVVKALADVDILLSTVGFAGWASQFPLIEALGKNGKKAVFIPPFFGVKYTEEDAANPALAGVSGLLGSFKAKAAEVGVVYTPVYAGAFTTFFFGEQGGFSNVKENSLKLNNRQKANQFPLSTTEYIGAGLAQLVTQSPSSIAGREFSLVEVQATGQEFIDAFTEVNGSAPTVSDYTEADAEQENQTAPLGPVVAKYKGHWQKGNFENPGQIAVDGWPKVTLVDLVRAAKAA